MDVTFVCCAGCEYPCCNMSMLELLLWQFVFDDFRCKFLLCLSLSQVSLSCVDGVKVSVRRREINRKQTIIGV